uniref:Uncharacterized protein n=1 Tax=Rhizophora mucronata TaxID=61149 RepID=A0A2P2N1C4_RHIMU
MEDKSIAKDFLRSSDIHPHPLVLQRISLVINSTGPPLLIEYIVPS